MAAIKVYKCIVSVFSFFLIIVALYACSDNPSSSDSQGLISHDGSGLSLTFTPPKFLAASMIPDLQCYATIDGTGHHPLIVDSSSDTVSGTITDVSAGTHLLGLTYFVSILGNDLVLCTYSNSISVYVNQTTTVDVIDTELNRNHDDDNDGYTNLAEIRIGTDALNRADIPAGESPFVMCGNGTTGTASSASYNAAVVIGPTAAGSASSAEYRVIVTYTEW